MYDKNQSLFATGTRRTTKAVDSLDLENFLQPKWIVLFNHKECLFFFVFCLEKFILIRIMKIRNRIINEVHFEINHRMVRWNFLRELLLILGGMNRLVGKINYSNRSFQSTSSWNVGKWKSWGIFYQWKYENWNWKWWRTVTTNLILHSIHQTSFSLDLPFLNYLPVNN